MEEPDILVRKSQKCWDWNSFLIGRNVDDQFALIDNEDLQLPAEQIGGKGSPTKVRKNIVVKRKQVEHKVVKVDDEGIDEVVCFLKEKGYL